MNREDQIEQITKQIKLFKQKVKEGKLNEGVVLELEKLKKQLEAQP
jgi:regulator of replication initiation timing